MELRLPVATALLSPVDEPHQREQQRLQPGAPAAQWGASRSALRESPKEQPRQRVPPALRVFRQQLELRVSRVQRALPVWRLFWRREPRGQLPRGPTAGRWLSVHRPA